MPLILAGRVRAVMAVAAVTCDIGMIEIRRQPRDRGVTVIAVDAAFNVCRVLARRGDAVVAGIAGADDMRVIDRHHGLPHVCRMAVLADFAGQNMRLVLAGRIRAVMAAGAVTGDIHVIKVRR